MGTSKFVKVESSVTSPRDDTRRKEVRIVVPPHCWLHDLDCEIREQDETYATRYKMDGSRAAMENPIHFALQVKTSPVAVIKLTVRFAGVIGLSEADQILYDAIAPTDPKYAVTRERAAKRIELVTKNFFSAVNSTWNNRFKVEIADPECGVRIIPIAYEAVRDETNPHYTIHAYGTYDREAVSENDVFLSLQTTKEVHVHEFAHCIGLPDEYSYSKTGERELIQYVKPDGSNDTPRVGRPTGDNSPETKILMSDGTPKFEERHGWPVAIELQKILSKETGRKITCRILVV